MTDCNFFSNIIIQVSDKLKCHTDVILEEVETEKVGDKIKYLQHC